LKSWSMRCKEHLYPPPFSSPANSCFKCNSHPHHPKSTIESRVKFLLDTDLGSPSPIPTLTISRGKMPTDPRSASRLLHPTPHHTGPVSLTRNSIRYVHQGEVERGLPNKHYCIYLYVFLPHQHPVYMSCFDLKTS
jgi:hypothetical protein